ncbi:BQ5605_C031g10953 [Microbotryum silenes-dioicae]|uniref:BQ5605_C031g10953 protein n=1 Tax=Microbotryum silenes-dioicae TaxID=796604 RepID=A0A2X0MLD6_9BASI|nr:BQ5605_C031g10953 [Microbotryum silenes-dioicae]
MIERSTTHKVLYLRSATPIRAYFPSSKLDRSFSSNHLPLQQQQVESHRTSTRSSSSASSSVVGGDEKKKLKEQQFQADELSSAFINASMSSSTYTNGPSEPSPPSSEESVAQSEAEAEVKALHSTSSFLAAQAELEEEREVEEIDERLKAQKKLEAKVQGQFEAWDGDETRERMIRRILQDQYKPLRVKGYKKSIIGEPTVVHPSVFATTEDPGSSNLIPTGTTSNQEDVPTSRPKKPWEYEYKAPTSHGTSYTHPQSTRSSLLIRTGPAKTTPSQRLASAREKTLDYTFGVGVTCPDGGGRTRVMVPSFEAEFEAVSTEKGGDSLRAWDGFVEDKVNQAIRNGLFKDLKGRGKPLKVDEAESNPFLPIEDRLINRVVKAQGAMPPWIELQQELQLNLSAFRNELRSAYTRRVTRMLSLAGNLSRSSVATVLNDSHRDVEWEERERSYHLASIGSLNALTRRFNIVAPYTARRGLLDLERELEACRRYCKPWIADELIKRIEGRSEMVLKGEEGGGKGLGSQDGEQVKDRGKVEERFWPALRRGIWELLGIGGKALAQGERQK